MNKINWINGQAGGTPLSAENLNQMQDNIEKAINEVDEKHSRHIITAKGDGGQIDVYSDGTKVPMATAITVGNKLTLTNDGGIQIGAGVSKIAFSASTTCTGSNPSQHALSIYKNSKTPGNRLARVILNVGSGIVVQPTISIPYQMTNEITEGDVLYLYASSDGWGISTGMSYMTVEAIE